MAVYNTNLSNVNNLLVNESIALTQDDKIRIIKEFKNVKSINESKTKYNQVLNDFKSSKKTVIDEGIADKINNSIHPSSKGKLDEVIEKTAYENNDGLNRIKDVIKKIERR
jgi:protein subunit release factor A